MVHHLAGLCLQGGQALHVSGKRALGQYSRREGKKLMHGRTSLAVAGFAVCIALFSAAESAAWPRPLLPAGARHAAPPVQVNSVGNDLDHLKTLGEYTTQELRLPLDKQRRAFEAVVTVDGDAKILDLHPYSLRSPDFEVLVQDATGQLVPVEAPQPQTYRGVVRGEAGSLVAASLVEGRMWATIDIPGKNVWAVQPLDEMAPGAPAPRSSHVVYDTGHVLPVDREVKCGVEPLGNMNHADEPLEGASEGGVAGTGFEVLEIGCDADFEYYQLNGSSVQNTLNDIESLLNAVEFIFERDVDLSFEITVIVVRSASNDPYTANNAGDLLDQFFNTWNTSPENGIRRDVGHLFTGRNLGSTIGIAATPSACATTVAYSLVESRYTTNSALRQSLSAHELGHTLSALHCNGNGDCHIMCSGNGGCDGISGPNLKFGFAAVAQITSYANSGSGSCMTALPAPLAPPFFDNFESASIDGNKWIWSDGGISTTAGVAEPSGTRALNLDSTGANAYDDDQIRTNFIDLGGMSNQVVSYFAEHRGVEAGETLTVDYWANNLRWINLAVITSDGVDQNNFEFHQHALPVNAHWAEFRVRFHVNGDSSGDDWYIDDVFVGADPGLVFGACCLQDFTCIEGVTQDQCVTSSSGTWQGDDSTCAGVDCTPPLGACCFGDQTCAPNTTQFGCEVTAGGTWQGEGVACNPGQCSPPAGSCCLSDGQCVDGTTESLCVNGFGGTYQGDDKLCSSTNCPQPTGACCDPDGQCFAGVTEDACTGTFGGTFQGANTECGLVECPTPANCPADFVDSSTFQPPPDGVVDAADLAFLLGDWGTANGSPADIVDSSTFQPPPDGVIDAADLAFLLGDWGTCE